MSVALLVRGMPTLDSLNATFEGSAPRADAAYALAHRAIAELAALDPERGLTLFFQYWRETRSLEVAIRRAFGVTQAQFEERRILEPLYKIHGHSAHHRSDHDGV